MSPPHPDALAYRFVGALLLFGGGVLLLVLAGLHLLPRGMVSGGPAFLVPGTAGRHAIGTAIVPVLAVSGGLLAGLGGLALWLGRSRTPFRWRAGRMRGARPPWRPAFLFLGGLTLLAVALLRR